MTGSLFLVFLFIFNMSVEFITRNVFNTVVTGTSYDEMDFYTAAGAFWNTAMAASYVPALVLAALIVKDRPLSSYFSSMGGWRWKIFFMSLAAGFVVFGISDIIRIALMGNSGEVKFTLGGFFMLALLLPLQGLAEEMLYRSFTMQTTGSWFKIPVIGLITQIVFFTLVHPYNVIGRIDIALAALLYGLICVVSRGIEAASALHILNNSIGIFMAGFGFGTITAEQTIKDSIIVMILRILFFLIVLYSDRKLHLFEEVKYDDVRAFNEKAE